MFISFNISLYKHQLNKVNILISEPLNSWLLFITFSLDSVVNISTTQMLILVLCNRTHLSSSYWQVNLLLDWIISKAGKWPEAVCFFCSNKALLMAGNGEWCKVRAFNSGLDFIGRFSTFLHSSVRNYLRSDPSLDKVDTQARAHFISQGPPAHSWIFTIFLRQCGRVNRTALCNQHRSHRLITAICFWYYRLIWLG